MHDAYMHDAYDMARFVAGVAELADALDSKSGVYKGCVGSSPSAGKAQQRPTHISVRSKKPETLL
jgi:hypothetical protein